MKAHILVVVLSTVFLLSPCFASPARALLQTGLRAPSFAVRDLDGTTVQSADFSRNKAVVVLFWSTWSARSPQALTRMEEYYRAYKDRGIQVVGINADNQTMSDADVVAVAKLAKELGISFPLLLDRGLKAFHDFNVIALPSTIVISGGKIIYELPGYPLVETEDMFDYLKVLAGDPPREKKEEKKYRPRSDAVADAHLARALVLKKRYAAAYPLYKKAIEKDPLFILPYIELSKLFRIEGKNAEAEDILRKAPSTEPGNAAVLSELGYVLTGEGKLSEAMAILEKTSMTESYTPSLYYYAYALGLGGKLKEALALFERALSLNPFDPVIYTLRAEIHEKSAMMKDAAADYRKALELLMRAP